MGPDQPQGFLAGLGNGTAIGEQAHLFEFDTSTLVQCRSHAGGILRLNTDNLGLRPDIAQISGNARDQAAATNTDKNVVQWRRRLPGQLHPHRALSSDNVGVIKRVQVGQALGLDKFPGQGCSRVVGVAVENHPGAEITHRINLDGRCGHGHDYGGSHIKLLTGQGHALGVVTGRRRHYAPGAGAGIQIDHLVVGTPKLERKHRLQVLTLQENLIAQAPCHDRGLSQGRLLGHVVNPSIENAFDVGVGHTGRSEKVRGMIRANQQFRQGRGRFHLPVAAASSTIARLPVPNQPEPP